VFHVVLLLQVNIVGKELGLGFAGIGFEPKWPLSARPSVPKVVDFCDISFKLM
jgi:gamma-glutamylcysteine synthetase